MVTLEQLVPKDHRIKKTIQIRPSKKSKPDFTSPFEPGSSPVMAATPTVLKTMTETVAMAI